MKAYLSGPMTGIPDHNYPAFRRAARTLRRYGHVVFDPSEAFDGQTDLPFTTYMRHDILSLLTNVDTVVVLPGWAESPGAVLEVAIGASLGYGILEYVESEDGSLTLESALPVHGSARERLAFLFGIGDYAPAVGAPELQEEPPAEVTRAVDPKRAEPLATWREADNGLLKAADHIVNGDRQRTYGHPIDHHTTTAELWQAYLRRANDFPHINVRPQDVSVLMILDKVSRVGGGDKVDNVLDIAGYAQVHAKVRARQEFDA